MLLLFGVAAAITGFVALCLLFFQATRRTYAGFGHWTAGVAIIAVAYLLFGLRGIIPLWVSVFFGNLAIPLGLLCQLDGIKLFLGFSTSRWAYLVVSALLASALFIFSFHWESIYWRGVSTSLPMIAVQWYMAALLFRSTDFPRSLFIKAVGSLLVLGGFLVLARIVWFALPSYSHQIWTSESEALFFIGFVTVHLGESFSMIMLNAERLESELLGAQQDLSHSVNSLEEALTKQKQAEESLRESEQLYRAFFETSRDPVFMTGLDGQFVDFNDTALEVLGYALDDRNELLHRNVASVYANPEERKAHVAQVARQGFSKEYPLDVRKKDGTVIQTLITTVARKDPEGNILGFQGTVRDITDRKHAEERLKVSEARYRAIFDNAGIGIDLLDQNGIILQVNQALTDMLGYSEEDLRQLTFLDITHPEDADVSKHNLEALMAGEIDFYRLEKRYLKKDGSFLWADLTTSAICGPNGEHTGTIGVISDITQRRQTEEALRESEERYRNITENSLTGIFVYQDGQSVFANRRLAEMVGYDHKEILSVPFLKAIHPDDRQMVREMAEARISGQTVPNHYRLRLLHKDGRTVWTEVLSHCIEYRGRPAILGNIADVTQRELLEQQLRQAQKMEAMGTLTGGIAHDFNNLLTVVNGYTEMVLLETAEDDPRYEDLQKVLQTGRKGAELVQRLLAFSKKGESNLQPLNLNRTVENSVALMKRTLPKMIEIEAVLGTDLSLVNADAAQVDQVLMNLCINAGEAMPDGGKLRIETKNVAMTDAYCSLHHGSKPGPHVLVEVVDTGTGMSNETMDRIFDPFFTTKGWDFKKGTGLGLSVAKGIVDQHGGWITCETEPGKGTTFSLYFPIIEDYPAFQKPEPSPESVRKGEKILLVDDEEYVRELGKRILERAGYTVITAATGTEALDIYAKEQFNIALVVLDLIMPQMGGEQCLEELLKINSQVKVIVSTGHSPDARERLLIGALARGFVNKPYEVRQLVQTVKETLGYGDAPNDR
jgi:two-component system, cell cycle sensor histidine kinase and response regulator CckA